MNVFQILNIFNHLSGHSIILVCEIIGIILITFTVFWQFEGLHLINSNHCVLAVLPFCRILIVQANPVWWTIYYILLLNKPPYVCSRTYVSLSYSNHISNNHSRALICFSSSCTECVWPRKPAFYFMRRGLI